ncbi:MAG: hypothetical protein U0T80_01080 [Flavobacteriaceae bacterium]
MKTVTSNGGTNNANTSDDRTYYFPKVFRQIIQNLVYGWSPERLMHPVINQIGVDTQNEVVKEEKDFA